MTGPEIREFMLAKGCAPFNDFELDANYAHPTRAWFHGPFAHYVVEKHKEIGKSVWRVDSNDCDDFANRAKQWAQDSNDETNPKGGKALAVGSFFYLIGGQKGSGHAIVAAIVYEDHVPELIFIEPQNGRPLALSKEEIRSCFGFVF